jgi:hypothetical protein
MLSTSEKNIFKKISYLFAPGGVKIHNIYAGGRP